MEIIDYRGIFSAYPVPRQATFESPDAELRKILEIGWLTHRLCMNETYFDTPQYEQLGYAGDGRLQAMTTYTNMWDDRINRNHLDQFWYSMRPEGLIQDRYPSREPQYMATYALDWIASIHDFYMYRDDPGFLKKFLPATRTILDWFEQRLDERGLMHHMSWADPKYNGPDRMGFNLPARVELGYILALQQAAELEEALGSGYQAAHYRSLIPRLKRAVFEALWSPEKGLLADTPEKTRFSEQVIVLGILSDVIPPDRQRAAMETALNPSSNVRQLGAFFAHFWRHMAMEKVGPGDQFLEDAGSVARADAGRLHHLGRGRRHGAAIGFPCLEFGAQQHGVQAAVRHPAGGAGIRAGGDPPESERSPLGEGDGAASQRGDSGGPGRGRRRGFEGRGRAARRSGRLVRMGRPNRPVARRQANAHFSVRRSSPLAVARGSVLHRTATDRERASTLRSYHTRQALARTMGWLARQPKAFWNSGMLETTPFTRYSPGECGSVAARSRACSSVTF